jgi:hypothetical protein
MPLAPTDTRYDRQFYAYLDTTTQAHALYKADAQNYEACFFLAAAYGFEARLHAERRDWRKATVSSWRALDYLQQSRAANGLSSEFELGFGLLTTMRSGSARSTPDCGLCCSSSPRATPNAAWPSCATSRRPPFTPKPKPPFFCC